jgi:hypothetical protein
MTNYQALTEKKKKKNKKPLILLFITFLLFGAFLFLITRKGDVTIAMEQIEMCNSIQQVKSIYIANQFDEDFYEFNETTGERELISDFDLHIRQKLNKLISNDDELKDCIEWLPQTKKSLNVIVIPDLSRRLLDSVNCNHQAENDIRIIDSTWMKFIQLTSLKMNSSDRFTIDVTDKGQANNSFDKIADNLQVDLSKHKNQSNRLFFNDVVKNKIKKNVRSLYKLSLKNPLGADYYIYLKRYISNHVRKSTIFEKVTNKVIILTDGYLEPQDRISYTPIYHKSRISKFNYDYRNKLYPAVDNGTIKETIFSLGLNIPVIRNLDLENVEILICEVIERNETGGIRYDFDILKSYWTDWLTRQKATVLEEDFLKREQSMNVTIEKIYKFLERD